MRFSSLASSSKANATYIEFGSVRLLVDCGLSARAAEQRLVERGIDPSTIQAILVTHEHGDHIKGVPSFSRRHRVPVYVNQKTSSFLHGCFHKEIFGSSDRFCVGNVEVQPFPIVHDAVDPVGYTFLGEGVRLGHVTDLGKVTHLVRNALEGVNALVLEANHDEEMLKYCRYPWPLKQRIAGSHGHLSNQTSAELLKDIDHSDLFAVVLGHLSEESNNPEQALKTFRSVCGDRNPETISCASPIGSAFLEAA